jgi:DNA-binding winged helix-turn-helix (wHTH) protein
MPTKVNGFPHLGGEEDPMQENRDTHGVGSFPLDYCLGDVSRIATAIRKSSSLLVIGMPGCGKSRLFDFLLHRPDALKQHGLSEHSRFIYVDCDQLSTDPQDMYVVLLREFDHDIDALAGASLDELKRKLRSKVKDLAPDINLVVVFDNFSRQLQQALGESVFDFLYALRNARQGLNISYIFVANLDIDFSGFSRLDRLFDQGPQGSVCWVSLLDEKDAVFSIERQMRRANKRPDSLSMQVKRRIYELTGGHALLIRRMSQLILDRTIPSQANPDKALGEPSIRAACQDIWNDLRQEHKNLLIDLSRGALFATEEGKLGILKDYGVLTDQMHFFSPLFECFVQEQEKTSEVVGACCNETRTRIIIQRTDDRQISFSLEDLAQRKRRLLCYLAENLGETCTKDHLKEVGWPSEYNVSDEALSRQIGDTRKWLRGHSELGPHLEIVLDWAVGYKLAIKG